MSARETESAQDTGSVTNTGSYPGSLSTSDTCHVILLAHGSSDPHWKETFEALARPSCDANPKAVVGYMELCEPSLEQQIVRLKKEGANCIKVVPLFLARGRHLRKDVPEMLERYRKEHGINLILTPPVGEHPALAQSIKAIVDDTLKAP